MLGFPGVTRSCQEVWQKVSGCARSCQELPPDFPDRSFIVQEMILEGKGTMTGWDSHSLVRRCQELKRDCQELSGCVAEGVRMCQELPAFVRGCQGLSGVSRMCQELSEVPGVAAGVVWSSQYMLGLPGVVRS